SEACRAFDVPVISGNVSMYNQSHDKAIYPTPIIGVVGLFEDLHHMTPNVFQTAGDMVYVSGEPEADVGGSELQYLLHGKHEGHAQTLDLEMEKGCQTVIQHATREGLLQSSERVSQGGLAAPPAKSAMSEKDVGVRDTLQHEASTALFAETQSRYLVSVKEETVQALETLCQDAIRSGGV